MQVKEGLFLALLVATLLMVASYTITLGLTNFSSHNKASEKLQPSTADAGGREGSEVSSDSLDKYQKTWDNVGFLPTPIKGILHQKNFYRLNLIFWIVMGCGIARFGRRGLKTTET